MPNNEDALVRTVAAARGIPPGEWERLSHRGSWRHTVRRIWYRFRMIRQRQVN